MDAKRILLAVLLSTLITAAVPAGGFAQAPQGTAVGSCAVVFQGALYLFVSDGSQVRFRLTTDGWTWTSPAPRDTLPITTDAAPSAAVYQSHLYLFYKDTASSSVLYRTFDGVTWTGALVPGGLAVTTAVAPTAAVEDDTLFLFVRDSSGHVGYRRYDGTVWTPASGLIP